MRERRACSASRFGRWFVGRALDRWAYLKGVELDFSWPGKPTDNAYSGAFNAGLRAESLKASWLLSMINVRNRIEEWRRDYNEDGPRWLDPVGLRSPS